MSETPSAHGEAEGEALPRRFGKYTLIRRLARGGMAELYLALHRSLAGFERLVVIKRILPELGRDQGFITMLLQEARIAATFSHPNIVTTFDVGQVDGEYFIAMEHIHGEDLRTVVRAMKPKGVKEFPIEHALAIGIGAAAGLAYAHEKRDLEGNPLHVVHRDVSPQNVLVTYSGDVKVVDFGIAKAAIRAHRDTAPPVSSASKRSATDSSLSLSLSVSSDTGAGKIKGKIPYMSPEQARGEELDQRSDVFSLGIILYELCTGRRLFRGGSDHETVQMILAGEYPDPSQVNARVSPRLAAALQKALSPDVATRYQSARELLAELESIVHEEHIAVSSVALGKWMETLFEERIAAQHEAVLASKQAADELHAGDDVDALESSHGDRPSVSSKPAPVAAPVPSRTPWIAAVLVAALGLAAVVVWRMGGARDATPTPSPTPSARPAVTAEGATLSVRSDPSGAAVWLDGRDTGLRTPATIADVRAGDGVTHALRLVLDGYASAEAEAQTPSPGAQVIVSVQLSAAPQPSAAPTSDATAPAPVQGAATLQVTTVPEGAEVSVDGRRVEGVTPLTVRDLAPDVEHDVWVHRPGRRDERFRFTPTPGQVETRTIQMQLHGPMPSAAPSTATGQGFLTVGATPWCTVSFDGHPVGQTPVVHHALASGRHTIACVNPQRGTQTRVVSLAPGQDLRVRIEFP